MNYENCLLLRHILILKQLGHLFLKEVSFIMSMIIIAYLNNNIA